MLANYSLGIHSLSVRIVRYFTIGFLVLGVMLAFTSVNNTDHLEELYAARVKEETSILQRDIDSFFKLTKVLPPDYSQWDDPYNYLLGKLPSYAKENLTQDTLEDFDTDVIWMFRSDGSPVYMVKNNSVSDADTLLKQYMPQILARFKNSYMVEFNIKTKDGFFTVFGSTVVPSTDIEHTSKSPGFMLVGKQISNSSLLSFNGNGRSKTEYVSQENDTKYATKYPAHTGLLAFSIPFKDINEQYIGKVYATYQDASIRELHASDIRLLIFNVALFLSLLVALLIMTWRWVMRPMNKLYKGLETSDSELIRLMMRDKSEFGKLAELIDHFFAQEASLEKEVKEKKELLARLAAYNTEIEMTNNVMIGRELKMIELKKELERLKKVGGEVDNA